MSRIGIVESTGSTNADLLADADAMEGDWLVALEQTAGKGRQGRDWLTKSGNFFGSTLVTLVPGDPPPQSLSLMAGLALIEAADIAAPDLPLVLKWPNDVLLEGRKLAGILLQRRDERVVIGFGVNLAAAPELPERSAAHLGARLTPQAFAPLLAGTTSRLLNLWRTSDPDAFAQAWLARAHPIGARLAVHAGAKDVIEGRFDGLELDGALRLRRDDGRLEIVRAGDVEL